MHTHSLSSEVLSVWTSYSLDATRTVLPINYIDYDDDTESGSFGYDVDIAGGSEPIELVNGQLVRRVAIFYYWEEVKHDPTNIN